MFETLISGKLGHAIYRHDGATLHLSASGQLRYASPYEVANTLSDFAGYEAFTLSSQSEIQSVLNHECDFENLLFLFFSVIEPGMSLSMKLQCAQGSELLLRESALKRRLEDRLLSSRLPSPVEASLRGTLEHFTSFVRLHDTLSVLKNSQHRIAEIQGFWSESSARLAADKRRDIRSEFVADGTFAALVRGIGLPNGHEFNSVMTGLVMRSRNSEIEPAATQLLNDMQDRIRRDFPDSQSPRKVLPSRNNKEPRALPRTAQFNRSAPPFRSTPSRSIPGADRRLTASIGQNVDQRRAMLRNLVTSLILMDRVETTVKKCKASRPIVEKMISLGKNGSVHARRQAASYLMTPESVDRLFNVVAPRYASRNGEYLRITRTGPRKGDAAELAYIELLGAELELNEKAQKRAEAREKKRQELERQLEEREQGGSEDKRQEN